MTAKPTWTSTVSVGNILTIVTFIAVSAGSFFTLQAQAENNEDKLRKVMSEANQLEARVVSLEISRAANGQRFENILSSLERIEASVAQIKKETLE